MSTIVLSPAPEIAAAPAGARSFVIRALERGHDLIRSDGAHSSYVAGHPDGFITRRIEFQLS